MLISTFVPGLAKIRLVSVGQDQYFIANLSFPFQLKSLHLDRCDLDEGFIHGLLAASAASLLHISIVDDSTEFNTGLSFAQFAQSDAPGPFPRLQYLSLTNNGYGNGESSLGDLDETLALCPKLETLDVSRYNQYAHFDIVNELRCLLNPTVTLLSITISEYAPFNLALIETILALPSMKNVRELDLIDGELDESCDWVGAGRRLCAGLKARGIVVTHNETELSEICKPSSRGY